MQRLRLQRFAMALATYTIVILATLLATRLGLGEMNGAQWVTYIGFALFGNGIFLVLFYTNANLRFSDPSLTREQIVYSSLWGMIVLYFLPEARPIVLMFYLPAFSFGMLGLTRRQFFGVEACVLLFYAALLGVEYFQYGQGFNIQYQLFLFILFGILLTWFAFFGGFVSDLKRRLRLQKEKIKMEMEERKIAQIEKEKLIVELKDALHKVKTLSGLLPICASCKKIHDDQGYWNQIESYIQIRSNAEFSHSICPDCAKKLYPDLDIYNEDE
jgi:diguanylate cyclase